MTGQIAGLENALRFGASFSMSCIFSRPKSVKKCRIDFNAGDHFRCRRRHYVTHRKQICTGNGVAGFELQPFAGHCNTLAIFIATIRKAQIPLCRLPRNFPERESFEEVVVMEFGPKGTSRVCRGRHGEVGIVEFGLNQPDFD